MILKGKGKDAVKGFARTAGLSFALLAAASIAAAQQQPITPEQTPLIAELPDSPGATLAKSQPPPALQNASEQSPSIAPQEQASQQQPPQPPSSQPSPQRPVGTAAAEPTHANGIAASQPAGVAVAPMKQRRVRTIVIRVGAIVGAGVAVGSVAALTMGTSSRPPGAH